MKQSKKKRLPKVANQALMRAMQEVRRSSAASPIPSGKRYRRGTKHRGKRWDA